MITDVQLSTAWASNTPQPLVVVGAKVLRAGGDQVALSIFSSVQNFNALQLRAGGFGASRPSVFDLNVPILSVSSDGSSVIIFSFSAPNSSSVVSRWPLILARSPPSSFWIRWQAFAQSLEHSFPTPTPPRP
jgi:hypothetical protein